MFQPIESGERHVGLQLRGPLGVDGVVVDLDGDGAQRRQARLAIDDRIVAFVRNADRAVAFGGNIVLGDHPRLGHAAGCDDLVEDDAALLVACRDPVLLQPLRVRHLVLHLPCWARLRWRHCTGIPVKLSTGIPIFLCDNIGAPILRARRPGVRA